MTTDSERRITLSEFARIVGCHPSTASKFRSGDRMPGHDTFEKIVRAFDLDPVEAMKAYCGSRDDFAIYLRAEVFKVSENDFKRDQDLGARRTT